MKTKLTILSLMAAALLLFPQNLAAQIHSDKNVDPIRMTSGCEDISYQKLDGGCCVKLISLSLVKSVRVLLTGGTIASASWNCGPISPLGYEDMATWLFVPETDCASLELTLCANPAPFPFMILFDVTMKDDTPCKKEIILDCVVPEECCPDIVATISNQFSYIGPWNEILFRNGIFHIENFGSSAGSICHVTISSVPAGNFTQGSLSIDGTPSSAWSAIRIPAYGDLYPAAETSVDFNLTATNYEGVVTVCVHRCNGEVCCYDFEWKTSAIDGGTTEFRQNNITTGLSGIQIIPAIRGAKVKSLVKYISFGLNIPQPPGNSPSFFAVSAGGQVGDVTDSNLAICSDTYMSKANAFFTLTEAADAEKGLGAFNLIFTHKIEELYCTLFDEKGIVLAGGMIKIPGSTDVSTGLEIETGGPATSGMFEFLNVYANPSDGQFKVQYAIDKQRDVELQVIDPNGRLLNTVRNDSYLPGIHTVSMDIRNLPKGNYFVRLISEGSTLSKPVIIK